MSDLLEEAVEIYVDCGGEEVLVRILEDQTVEFEGYEDEDFELDGAVELIGEQPSDCYIIAKYMEKDTQTIYEHVRRSKVLKKGRVVHRLSDEVVIALTLLLPLKMASNTIIGNPMMDWEPRLFLAKAINDPSTLANVLAIEMVPGSVPVDVAAEEIEALPGVWKAYVAITRSELSWADRLAFILEGNDSQKGVAVTRMTFKGVPDAHMTLLKSMEDEEELARSLRHQGLAEFVTDREVFELASDISDGEILREVTLTAVNLRPGQRYHLKQLAEQRL